MNVYANWIVVMCIALQLLQLSHQFYKLIVLSIFMLFFFSFLF